MIVQFEPRLARVARQSQNGAEDKRIVVNSCHRDTLYRSKLQGELAAASAGSRMNGAQAVPIGGVESGIWFEPKPTLIGWW
jgi:hypothetical protein